MNSYFDDPQGIVDVEEEAFSPDPIPRYDTAFPPLERSPSPRNEDGDTGEHQTLQFNPLTTRVHIAPLIKTSRKTEHFKIPIEERRFAEGRQGSSGDGPSQGWEARQRRTVEEVSARFRVSIDINLSKDGTLSVFMTGLEQDVHEAKKQLLKNLQTQCQISVTIPCEHHKALLGAKGAKLREIEAQTATKIHIPRPEEKTDAVTVTGTKDGVAEAMDALLTRVAELERLGFERIPMPRLYQPLVCRKSNTALQALIDAKRVRISKPPRDEVTVSGEKEAVQEAVLIIQRSLEKMKRECQEFTIELSKEKHRYVVGIRGSGITEILEQTGVVVDVPPFSSPTNSVRLFGPKAALGPALTMVVVRSESAKLTTVPAPAWLHRFIIGKKGATLEPLTKGKEKVSLSFDSAAEEVRAEGPPEDVDIVVEALQQLVGDLLQRLACEEIDMDPALHRHVIGKEGSNATRLRRETGVALHFPPQDGGGGRTIRIEGTPAGVQKAKKDILTMVDKIENTKSKDVIIDHKLIPRLIGNGGKRIREITDRHPKVRINFPGLDKPDSDVVSLRGPREDVEAVAKAMKNALKLIEESSYSESVFVAKAFHKNVIGREGANIKALREETNTRVDLPLSNSTSEFITVTGKRNDVKAAVKRIAEIQAKQANILEVSLEVASHLHTRLIGRRGQRVIDLEREYGPGIQIRFPGAGSTTVKIRGPADNTRKVLTKLEEMVEEAAEQWHEETLNVPFHMHRFIIGSRGGNARRIREESGAKVIFPDREEKERDCVRLSGTKTSVLKAKELLEETIKAMDEIVKEVVMVDQKWHRHFTKRRGVEIGRLSDTFGVKVTMPKAGTTDDRVTVEGPKDKVQEAIQKIRTTVDQLENTVSEEMLITYKHRQALVEKYKEEVFDICTKYNVEINLPPTNKQHSPPLPKTKETPHINGNDSAISSDSNNSDPSKPLVNGTGPIVNGGDITDGISETSSTASSLNLGLPLCVHPLIITGLKEDVAEVKKQLYQFCPVEEEVSVPSEFHSGVIGARGRNVQEIQRRHGVFITVPNRDVKVNYLTLTGLVEHVAAARREIEELVDKLKKEKEDRIARNFKLSVEVPSRYHSQVIGPKGATIGGLRRRHEVQISVPEPGKGSNEVVIRGYQDKSEAAREEILALVKKWDSYITEELVIDPRVHPRLIGSKGTNLERIKKMYRVDVSFPGRQASAEELNLVRISGESSNVDQCSDYLINEANEMLAEIEEREGETPAWNQKSTLGEVSNLHTLNGKPEVTNGPTKSRRGFLVSDAPWQRKKAVKQENGEKEEEFPTPRTANSADLGTDQSAAADNVPTNSKSTPLVCWSHIVKPRQ